MSAGLRGPVVAAWGAGTNSTAMIIELVRRGEIPEITLLAAMPEQPHTRRLIPVFRQWMDDHGVPNEIVEYQPRFFKQWARYGSLLEACLTNSTLSSIAFGLHSCSLGLATKSVLSSRRCAVMFQADRRAYPKSWRWSA
jgi:hypothetical protein